LTFDLACFIIRLGELWLADLRSFQSGRGGFLL